MIDNTKAYYHMIELYTPSAENGLRHDDPKLAIELPELISERTEKDRLWPLIDNQGSHA